METSQIPDVQKKLSSEEKISGSGKKKKSVPADTTHQESVIDVDITKVSPPGGEEESAANDPSNKTPVRASKPVDRISVHPIAMKSVRKPSVDQMKCVSKPSVDPMKRRTTAVPETTVPAKVMRVETSTSKPTTRGVPNRISLQKKSVAAVTGEGNSRDKMDPALASSTSNVNRKAGQGSAPSAAKADAPKKMVTRRVVRGGHGSEL